jgi:hypothetical protein
MSTSPVGTTPSDAGDEIVARTVAVRRFILEFLRRELVGPAPGLPAVQSGVGGGSYRGEEILRPQDSPRLRYGAGILFPQRTTTTTQDAVDAGGMEAAQTTEQALADLLTNATQDPGSSSVAGARSEADTEQEVNRANEYLPSAIGLTALVKIPTSGLRVRVRAARYVQRELAGRGRTDTDGKYHPYDAWWRVPILEELVIPAAVLLNDGARTHEFSIETGDPKLRMSVHVFSRRLNRGALYEPGENDGDPGQRIVTVTLLNRTECSGSRPQDEECLFQCRFAIEGADGSRCFLDYPEREIGPDAPKEEASLRLLYRDRRIHAVGHGCAPDWTSSDRASIGSEWVHGLVREGESDSSSEGGGAMRVWTESIPAYEIPPVLPRELPGVDLLMHTLSDQDTNEPIELCYQLSKAYGSWIEERAAEIGSGAIPDDMLETAQAHMGRCTECLRRIDAGIALLSSDRRVRRAFALMNKAMRMQQLHYGLASNDVRGWIRDGATLVPERPYVPPDYDSARNRWRPFQLGFILMNLRSLADPSCEERSTVDVIWFPTGGGKTEAYLGLTAYALFLRRLRNPANAGTTALMRYTLRLLTAQQYQRAASLICACEQLRREDPDLLGTAPLTIGLWVGGGVTPNNEREAVAALRRLWREGTGNPFVLLSCPWCGVQMGPVKVGNAYETPGYSLLAHPQRVRFVCSDPECAFHDDRGLPLLVVDEHMYAEPPSLLVGTVDKFALLPWYPRSAALFGIRTEPAVSPPELIIQDELHLISGPLGSMVGHYETLIDTLCRDVNGVPAKIVASTATISRAAEQVSALYARDAFLFPPQGVRSGDSFFAEERLDRPGRMYVGVFATGLPSQQTAMVRVLSALLQAPLSAPGSDAAAIDPYWTLIAYFNSIRELGSAATLVSADIREYLGVTYERLGLTPAWGTDAAVQRRFLNTRGSLELTGRVSGSAVTEALQQLFIARGESRSVRDNSGRSGQPAPDRSLDRHDLAVDICLATNMIQVGLDVPRLGLMVVAGQPKMTSEYIQATSRVGRNMPGIVVTLYSPSKPRDRSHYEHFRAYHESIYRYVEPTSVTPFAVPVRERALHALMIALIRFWGDASIRDRPTPPPSSELMLRVRETLLARVAAVDGAEHQETETMIDQIISEWRRLPPSRYGDFGPPDNTVPFMYPSGAQTLPSWQDRARATPSSMRNVDAECDARVITVFPRD